MDHPPTPDIPGIWSEEEKATLTKMKKGGYSWEIIAKRLDRPKDECKEMWRTIEEEEDYL